MEHLKEENQAVYLYVQIAEAISKGRSQVVNTANLVMVHTYYEIGRMIVKDEQGGAKRASYGKNVLKILSNKLVEEFGKGFSIQNLRNMRKFYLVYSPVKIQKRQRASVVFQSSDNKRINTSKSNNLKKDLFKLSWSHYLILMRIELNEERQFYEIEATCQNWSEAQLKRQFNASLYERLVLSRDKEEVFKLSSEGNVIIRPQDILKNPLTLDFLGLEDKFSYNESDIEEAVISKLQDFLLELGKGFLFESRQKRFTFDEKYFYVDLVFYNRLLQCYVLIDLKTEELMHQDLGQMQMYVNYYDRYVKLEYEKPTIGILLCKKKSDALVELTLPTEANIYASEYSLYLPEKQLLKQKMEEWVNEFEMRL